MLDHLCVVSHGGVVLFSWTSKQLRRDPINQLIRSVLIEDRAGETEYTQEDYKVRWSLANEAQFVVVAVYQRFLQLLCIDNFLKQINKKFIEKFGTRFTKSDVDAMKGIDFEEAFQELYEVYLADEQEAQGENNTAAGMSAISGGAGTAEDPIDVDDGPSSPTSGGGDGGISASASSGDLKKSPSLQASKSFVGRGGKIIGKRGGKGSAAPPVGGKGPASPTSAKQPKKPKEARVWDDKKDNNGGAVANEPIKELTEEERAARKENFRKINVRTTSDGKEEKIEDKNWDKTVERGRVATWFRSRFGQRELDAQDFTTVLPQLKEKMISKNVAVEISENVCDSIEAALSGKKLGSFDSLPAAIEKEMVSSLHRILEPRREINILREIGEARARRKPYSIVFCGVNGVGKSTNLAKVAYWLQQHGMSILLAACDTFRTGAVEQLMVHGDCLDIPVFSSGQSAQNADAAAVAKNALEMAQRQGTDVVLIDTAGRMQDHESRMRALAKLIHDNLPDLVLFVGEAVVGNTGVDQLRKFNQCLVDYTPLGKQTRGIDGILLTKFDTIDDKVGAAVSMVYELSQPIVFVGVGQQYQDLKTINADVVVNMLMQ